MQIKRKEITNMNNKYLVWWSYIDANTKERIRDWKYIKDTNILVTFIKEIDDKHKDDSTLVINYIDLYNVAPKNQFDNLKKSMEEIKKTILSTTNNDDMFRVGDKNVRCYDNLDYQN